MWEPWERASHAPLCLARQADDAAVLRNVLLCCAIGTAMEVACSLQGQSHQHHPITPNLLPPTPSSHEQVLPQPSQLVAVTLERPLGIEFEEDARRKRVVVCGFTPGAWWLLWRAVRRRQVCMSSILCWATLAQPSSAWRSASPLIRPPHATHAGGHAEQRMRQAKLNASAAAAAALEGDVLRACTCTNIVYPPQALAFGMQPPTRSIVVYGADGQTWPQVVAALKKGLVSDGTVTLVLERRLQVAAAGSGAAARGAAAAAGSGAAGAAGSGSGGGSGGSSGG